MPPMRAGVHDPRCTWINRSQRKTCTFGRGDGNVIHISQIRLLHFFSRLINLSRGHIEQCVLGRFQSARFRFFLTNTENLLGRLTLFFQFPSTSHEKLQGLVVAGNAKPFPARIVCKTVKIVCTLPNNGQFTFLDMTRTLLRFHAQALAPP